MSKKYAEIWDKVKKEIPRSVSIKINSGAILTITNAVKKCKSRDASFKEEMLLTIDTATLIPAEGDMDMRITFSLRKDPAIRSL